MAECKRCGRPGRRGPAHGLDYDAYCWAEGNRDCRIAAAAYRCGILRGVELAKESARVLRHGRARDDGMPSSFSHEINWTETDREAAKLAGEGT